MKVVIIIPTYNESLAITPLLHEIEQEVIRIEPEHDWQVLVVDGNSSDDTAEQVRSFARANHWLTLLEEPEKRGLAAAYLSGIQHAISGMQADAFVEFDGDGQHDPRALPLLRAALEEGADYVIGSRYLPGGTVPRQWGFFQRFLSRFGSFVSRLLLELPVHDVTSGLKMTRVRGAANLLPLREEELLTRHYAYKIQFLHAAVQGGARIMEIPIAFRHREYGASKSTWRDITESLKVIALLRLRALPQWRFLRVALIGGFGFIVQYLVFEFASIQFHLLSPAIAALIGSELAIISNFTLGERWAFADRAHAAGLLPLRFIRFQIASLSSVIVQWLLLFTTEHLTTSHLLLRFALVLGVGVGFILNYCGYYFWVWSKRTPHPPGFFKAELVRSAQRARIFLKEHWLIIALCLFTLCLYLAVMGRGDIYSDNSLNLFRSLGWLDYFGPGQYSPLQWMGHTAWWTSISFQDAPPLVFALQHIFLRAMGESAVAARMPYVLAALIGGAGMYGFVVKMCDKRTALFAAGILLLSSYSISSTLQGYLEGIEVLFILLSFLFFTSYFKFASPRYLYGGAVFLGLALISKYTALFAIPSMLFLLVTQFPPGTSGLHQAPPRGAYPYAIAILVTCSFFSSNFGLLFACIEGLILLRFALSRERKYLNLSVIFLVLKFFSLYTATIFIVPAFLFVLFNPVSLDEVWHRLKDRKVEFWYAALIVVMIFSPVLIYNDYLLVLHGSFDSSLAAILGTHNDLARKPSLDLAGNGIAFFNVLYRASSLPFLLAYIGSIAWLGAKSLRKRATIVEYSVVVFTLFLFSMFCFMGVAERFESIAMPFLALAIALTVSDLYTRFPFRPVTLIAASILASELFYAVNTNMLLHPLGMPGIAYSTDTRVGSFGYNELDAYLHEVLSPLPTLRTPTKFAQIQALTPATTITEAPQTVVVYDGRYNWFASWWYLQRYRIYYDEPFYSTYSPLGRDLFNRYGAAAPAVSLHKTVYFIYEEDASLPGYTFDRNTAAFVAQLDQRGVPSAAIRNAAGVMTFRVYKIEL
jgi:dolichol-phosphate mannosyltransferase